MSSIKHKAPKLRKTLGLGLLTLYGIGATIGAGIYVLIGAAAGYAGMYAPFAFIIAAIGIIPTAMSYAELSSRLPVSSGEAAYVNFAFRSPKLSQITGGLVILSGIVASATITVGCAGYLQNFWNLPEWLLITIIIAVIGAVAIKGILESVIVTSLLTLIEVGALIVIIYIGFSSEQIQVNQFWQTFPPLNELAVWPGIISASAIAVFAFIGFEDMVNVAEETKNPKKVLPKAIFITLAVTAILYALVAFIAVTAVPPAELMQSDAPLTLVYYKLTGNSTLLLSAVAVFATANTILVQVIMVSRVAYGMAEQKTLPAIFGRINGKTRTPVLATISVVLVVLILAVSFPLVELAEMTSLIILAIWILINVSLIYIKLKKRPAVQGTFVVPIWIPFLGTLFGIALLLLALFMPTT